MKINNPINGTMESKRDYILDVTPENGNNTAIGPYPGNVKYSIVLGGQNNGNVFTFTPQVLSPGDTWPSTQ